MHIKVLFIGLLTLFAFCTPVSAQGYNKSAKGFKKGLISFDVGFGASTYATQVNDPQSNIENSGTWMIPIAFELGASDRIGVGMQVEQSTPFQSADSSLATRSFNLMFKGTWYYYNKANQCGYLQFLGGYSSLFYDRLDSFDKVETKGVVLQFGLGYKYYFSDHIGVFINANMANYNYQKFEDHLGETLKVTPEENLSYTRMGLSLAAGLSFKL